MRHTTAKTFTIAAVSALALGIAPAMSAADKGCSNASLQGTFAYTGTGFVVTPVARAGPFAEVGTQTFDGKGATTTLLRQAETATYSRQPLRARIR